MERPKPLKITDEKIATTKAEHFCAYQERSQQEVRNKLYEWGVPAYLVENIIGKLITDNFLNEERFARIYALSKFNQKQWGKIKIKQGLKLKKVPEVLVKKALGGIDADEYTNALLRVLQKKAATLTEKNKLKRTYKLQQYAMSRGYETNVIVEVLKNNEL